MATCDLLESWHRLHAQQTDWAFRAHDRLISSLSEDVRDKLGHKDGASESFVVIFGETQVGKTTLLLDLMGVAVKHIGTVSGVLRGGRVEGDSSTATAMEYIRSDDDCWGLGGSASDRVVQWFDSDAAITRSLGELREKMQSGLLQTDSPCVVHIPKCMFEVAGGARPIIRILDLPGHNPTNATEQQHVHAMAKTYIPFADLVLLVGRVEGHGFLKPDVLTLPGIRDWQKLPHRFRIVTTYTYTNEDIRTLIRKRPQLDATFLRQHLVQQIEIAIPLSEATRHLGMYFPLEFGTSWVKMQAHEPALYSRIAPLIETLRTELLDHIANATSPISRMRNTLNTHLGIKAIQEEKRDVIRKARCVLRKQKRLLASDLGAWNKGISEIATKCEATAALRTANSVEMNKRLIASSKTQSDETVAPLPDSEKIKSAKTVKDLQVLMRGYKLALVNMRLVPETQTFGTADYWKRVKRKMLEPEVFDLKLLVEKTFADIRTRLDDYWLDTYLNEVQFRTDLNAVLHAFLKSYNAVHQRMADAWFEALAEVGRELQADLETAESQLLHSTTERNTVNRKYQAIGAKIGQASAALKNVRQEAEEDLIRCEKLFHLMDEEYLAALNAKFDMALVANDDCEALLQILACEGMRQQRNDFLELSAKQVEASYGTAK